jgi:hypothetical protein
MHNSKYLLFLFIPTILCVLMADSLYSFATEMQGTCENCIRHRDMSDYAVCLELCKIGDPGQSEDKLISLIVSGTPRDCVGSEQRMSSDRSRY